MLHPRVLQIHRIHQVVQSHVGITAAQARQKRSQKSQKSIQRISPKRTEEQVEPHYIGFQLRDGLQQAKRIQRIVELPAAPH
jgi:hypothetical protein